MTGLGAFEEHLPYQNYQGSAIVVRYITFVRKKSRYFAKHSLSMQKKIYGPSHHTAALNTEAKYLANAVFRHAMQKSWL